MAETSWALAWMEDKQLGRLVHRCCCVLLGRRQACTGGLDCYQIVVPSRGTQEGTSWGASWPGEGWQLGQVDGCAIAWPYVCVPSCKMLE